MMVNGKVRISENIVQTSKIHAYVSTTLNEHDLYTKYIPQFHIIVYKYTWTKNTSKTWRTFAFFAHEFPRDPDYWMVNTMYLFVVCLMMRLLDIRGWMLESDQPITCYYYFSDWRLPNSQRDVWWGINYNTTVTLLFNFLFALTKQ